MGEGSGNTISELFENLNGLTPEQEVERIYAILEPRMHAEFLDTAPQEGRYGTFDSAAPAVHDFSENDIDGMRSLYREYFLRRGLPDVSDAQTGLSFFWNVLNATKFDPDNPSLGYRKVASQDGPLYLYEADDDTASMEISVQAGSSVVTFDVLIYGIHPVQQQVTVTAERRLQSVFLKMEVKQKTDEAFIEVNWDCFVPLSGE